MALLQLLAQMVLSISGTRIVKKTKDSRLCRGAINQFLAARSTMMGRYMHMRYEHIAYKLKQSTERQGATFISVQKKLIDFAFEAPLSLHKELDHQEAEVRFGSFSLKLQKVVTDHVVLSDIWRSYIGIIEKQLEVAGLSSSAKLFLMHQVMVWELIKVLFYERQGTERLNDEASDDNEEDMMQDVKEDSAEVNTEALPLIRRAEFSCWLQESVIHRVQEDVGDLKGSGYLEHLFFLLTGGELDSAVELAIYKGDVRLACLLSQAGGSTVNRNDILQQLHLWRRNGLDSNCIEKERIKL